VPAHFLRVLNRTCRRPFVPDGFCTERVRTKIFSAVADRFPKGTTVSDGNSTAPKCCCLSTGGSGLDPDGFWKLVNVHIQHPKRPGATKWRWNGVLRALTY